MNKVPLLAVLFVLCSSLCLAEDLYVAQTGAGSDTGANCANARNAAWFNTAANWATGTGKISAGDTVHLCGTFTGTAGSTMLAFQASGTAGNPITLLFEPGAQLNAPAWGPPGNGGPCGGAISMCGRSFVTVDGGGNGIIQNTANGDTQSNQLSTGIDAESCNSCTVKNLTIANIYVHHTNGPASIDETLVRAITFTGSNWLVTGNTIHDCGWCLFDAYGNGDNNITVAYNDISAMGHGLMFATSGANSATNMYFHDNKFHDTTNWDTAGCSYHDDGIHMFGTTGSSMTNLYVYNNYFYGDWGTCPTGFIFTEGLGSSTPTHLSNSFWWNNVMIVNPSSPITNTNGWFGLNSGESGVTQVFNNVIIGPNPNDNTLCYEIQEVKNLYF